jgi:drug/metabolite transporter (DMT)-like permease
LGNIWNTIWLCWGCDDGWFHWNDNSSALSLRQAQVFSKKAVVQGLFSSSQGTPWNQLPIPTMGRTAWFKVVLGVAMVNFLSPAMNNYSIFQIPLALALTLGSIGPLYALPLVWFLQWEKPTLRAFLGAALAVLGVVILSFCVIQNSVLLSNNVPM